MQREGNNEAASVAACYNKFAFVEPLHQGAGTLLCPALRTVARPEVTCIEVRIQNEKQIRVVVGWDEVETL